MSAFETNLNAIARRQNNDKNTNSRTKNKPRFYSAVASPFGKKSPSPSPIPNSSPNYGSESTNLPTFHGFLTL
jgi:hypothetical protein